MSPAWFDGHSVGSCPAESAPASLGIWKTTWFDPSDGHSFGTLWLLSAAIMKKESGQISVLIIGCSALIGLLAVVVINSSAAFLQQQRLADLADGAALAGADAVQAEQIYTKGIRRDLPLNSSAARKAAIAYLAGNNLTWDIKISTRAVQIELRKPLKLPLVPPGWRSQTVILAESTALLRTN